MIRLAALLLLAAALAGCAARPTHPDAFSFGVYGDTPYSDAEEKAYLQMLARIDREPLAFVVHVGDFKGGGPCTEALYQHRKAQFDQSAHPLVYTPGDNEWTDCRRPAAGSMDALERLARLRQVFFADRWALGRARLELLVQDKCADADCACPAHPENRFWSRAGVRFVTLHIVGSRNNYGFDAASDAEARCRDGANAAWLERAVRASEHSQTRALVVIIQANPWDVRGAEVYRAFLSQLRDAVRRVRKPVLLVHGDTHIQRVDTPLRDAFGNPILEFTRLETFGSPFVGWVKVTVDPDDPQVFRFEPRLQGIVPP
jgi:hypothetical protein